MPRGNGTGPNGLGSMTGRGAGFCAGYSAPGFTNPIAGVGRGRGRGFRNMSQANWNARDYYPNQFYAQPGIYAQPGMTAAQEAEALKNQAKYLQDDLNALNDRIQELNKFEAKKENSE